MSSPKGMKSSGRDFPAPAKLAAVEREIIDLKKKVKKIGIFPGASEQMDILRSIARDYRGMLKNGDQGGDANCRSL